MTINVFNISLCTITIGAFGVIIYWLIHPEVVEKWAVLIYRVGYFISKHGSKKIVKHDIQGRINEFSKLLGKEIANWEPVGINVEWVKTDETATDFFRNNKLVIRMRHHSDQDKNFVMAAMVFISKSVLTKAKKYLSNNQKESLDLFIGKRLCLREKPRIAEKFFDEVFGPKTDSSNKIVELLDKYEIIDRVGIFYLVLVQELNFLGQKVFSQPRNPKIIEEVTHFINFLEGYANREIGDEAVKTEFTRKYCRCGIVIIAKSFKTKRGDTAPFIQYIKSLVDGEFENIYLIGSAKRENRAFIEKISFEVQQKFGYLEHFSKRYVARILISGKRTPVHNFLILIRSPHTIQFYDKELEEKLFGE